MSDCLYNVETDPLLSMKELCARLPISHAQIRRMVAAGTFPAPIHLGTRPFWSQSLLQRYLGAFSADSRPTKPSSRWFSPCRVDGVSKEIIRAKKDAPRR